MSGILLTGLREIYSARGAKAVVGEAETFSVSDGAILVQNGQIAGIDRREVLEREAGPSVERVDMGGRVAIPCFVDPHTHLIWGGDRAAEFNQRLHGATYQEIAARGGGIKHTVGCTRAASHTELFKKGWQTLDTMLLHGVATIEAKSGYGLDRETEFKQLDIMDRLAAEHPVELVQTFMGAHDIGPEFAGNPAGYIDFLNSELLPAVKDRGSVRCVDIFCEKGVFELTDTRRHLEAALDLGFQLRIHADELFPLGGAGLAADMGAVSADHVIHAVPADMAKMARAGTMATLLPGTSFFLRFKYADARGFQDAGCAIALSTDYNPGSSHTVSQALIMALACMNLGMTFEAAFCGVTLNAAASLGLADRIGTLEVGKQADIAFLDVPSALYLVYYWGINHVADVMKAGRFVVRNRARA